MSYSPWADAYFDMQRRWAEADARWWETVFEIHERMPLHPIPNLPHVAYPKTVRSHDLAFNYDELLGAGSMDAVIRDLQQRLAAEAARLRRLLPVPPWGFEWRAELSYEDEHRRDFAVEAVYRIRYRLVEIPVGERDYGV